MAGRRDGFWGDARNGPLALADLPDQPRFTLAPLGLSLVLHALLLMLLAVWAQPVRDLPDDEPLRPVAIVLATTDPRERVSYLEPAEAMRAERTFGSASESAAPSPVPSVEQLVTRVPAELALPSLPQGASGVASPAPGPLLPAAGNDRHVPLTGDLEAWLARERAGRKGEPPAGDPVGVRLFAGPPSIGRSFVFLIDRSKSMGSEGLGALQAAEEELLTALVPLQPVHRFQVIAYHHECVFLHRRELLPATEENKQAVRGFLRGLAAFGATEHERALHTALIQAPDVLYLLTDGGDPELSEPQIRTLTRLAADRTAIHCIQFGFGVAPGEPSFLQRLATRNRGSYQYVNMSRPPGAPLPSGSPGS